MLKLYFTADEVWQGQNVLWLSDRVSLLVWSLEVWAETLVGPATQLAAVRYHPDPPAKTFVCLDHDPANPKPIHGVLLALPNNSHTPTASEILLCPWRITLPPVSPWLPHGTVHQVPNRLT